MQPLTLVLALGLSGVLVVAGVAKLADLSGATEAAQGFGVPEPLSRAVGLALPIGELVLGALLVPVATRVWAAVGTLILLLVFCAAIATAMARGRAPDCHCFGQLHSEPVGWATLARNTLLAVAAAVVAVAGPGASAIAWLGDLDGIEAVALGLGVAAAALAVGGGFVLLHLVRSYGRVLVRLDRLETRLRSAGFDLEEAESMAEHGLEPGTPAPTFWLESTTGERVALADLVTPGRPLVLLFTSPTCGPCSTLMPRVTEWQREHADEITVALLSAGDPSMVREDAAEHGLVNVLLDTDLQVYEAYEANGTPSALIIGDDGRVASWLAAGTDWIDSLVGQALGGRGRTPGLPVGTPAPDLSLNQLAGEATTVSALVERPTVVLFWNPGCGYCRAMHEDVRTWEARSDEARPRLLVVSAGEADEVRAEGFASTVLLDPEWELSGLFGADGTPMAVLLDADGTVARPMVGGADEVLALLETDERLLPSS
jgi:thiol-disulfide isomerase/thioredoxin/uncharacterized membrane protein YphA (DoxX/SURF4 family)